jgi:hypothetical protein
VEVQLVRMKHQRRTWEASIPLSKVCVVPGIRQGQFQQASKRAISEQDEEDREAEVRRRAYKIWQLEGKPKGLAEQHWERAKQEVHQQEQAEARRDGAAGQRTGIQPHGDGGTSLRRDLADR